MSRILKRISGACERYPVGSAVLSCGVIFTSGDLLTQVWNVSSNTGKSAKKDQDSNKIDWIRTGNIFGYGVVVLGPFLGVWYTRVLPWLVGEGHSKRAQVFRMVVYDQLIESVFADSSYLYCVKYLEMAYKRQFVAGSEGEYHAIVRSNSVAAKWADALDQDESSGSSSRAAVIGDPASSASETFKSATDTSVR